MTYFDCPSTRVAPVTDVAFTALWGLSAISASSDDPDTAANDKNVGLARTFGVFAGVAAASAVYGFIVTSKCESAKEQLAVRILKTHEERLALEQARDAAAKGPALCSRDVDCKGDRICASGVCVEPPPAVPAAPQSPAAAAPAPEVPAPEPPAPSVAPPAPELPPLQPGSRAP